MTIKHASVTLKLSIFAHLTKFGTFLWGNVCANIAKQIALTITLTLISAKKEPKHLSALSQHQWQSTTLIT